MRKWSSFAVHGLSFSLLGVSFLTVGAQPTHSGEPVILLNSPQQVGTGEGTALVVPQRVMLSPVGPHAGWPVTGRALQQSASASPPSIVHLPKTPASHEPKFAGSLPAAVRLHITRYNRKVEARAADTASVAVAASAGRFADPNLSTITCIAGCIGERGASVYSQPLLATRPESAPAGVQAAVVQDPAKAAGMITCVAGCYGAPKSYQAGPAGPPRPASQQTALLENSVMTAAAAMQDVAPAAERRIVRPRLVRQTKQRPSAKPRTQTPRYALRSYLPPRAY
jgi:hypothetical protein